MMQENYHDLYAPMHRNDKVFRGFSIKSAVPDIARLIKATAPRSILDYGCGKGRQYSERNVHEEWGGLMPHLYDVGVPAFAAKPKRSFDAVICTDVMEHIAEADVDAIIADIFRFVPPRDDGGTCFAMFWISCRAAKRKTLADGRNVHLTVRPGDWWAERLTIHQRGDLIIEARYETDDVT